MNCRYFYANPESFYKDNVFIAGSEYEHLVRVLRKKRGDIIKVVDGMGMEYVVKLYDMDNRCAKGKILEKRRKPNEPLTWVAIAVGVVKSRMDEIFAKGTELGVSAFYPFISERTEIFPSDRKINRWKKIIQERMKQSRRSVLPLVREPTYFYQLVNIAKEYKTCILLDEWGENKFSDISVAEKVLLVVGPEGSLTDEEKELLEKKEFYRVKIGPRTLRTETACISGLSILMSMKGEM